MVTAYATGRWDEALSAAADLDLVCGPDTPARHSSRLVVAEIHAQRGQREQAEASLARVPAVDGLVAARGWAEMGLLAGAGDYEAAFSAGARAYALVSADDTDPVVLPLLLRLLATASAARLADQARWLLAEVQARQRMCDRDPSWRLLLLLARGVAERDAEAALAAVDAARTCGQRLGLLEACLAATSVVAEPKPLLCEAYEVATELRAEPLRAAVRARMKSFRVAPPRSRSLAGLSDTQTRIIELIRAGKTNRQIAAELGVSEKTVERHLTRLFGKTGCRSRVELATTTAADQVLAIGA